MLDIDCSGKDNLNRDNAFYVALEAIVDVSPFALNLWDSNMNNLACNKQTLHLFNLTSSKDFLEDFYKFSPEYQPNGITSIEMTHRNMDIALNQGFHKFKWMHLSSDGEEIPAEVTLTKIALPDNDHSYIVGFVRDLRPEFQRNTTQNDDDFYFPNKLPEKAVLSHVAEMSDDVFFVIDRRTTTIQFLGAEAQNSYFQMNDSKTTPAAYDENIIHPDDVQIYQGMVANMQRGITTPIDLRFLHHDGSYRYHRITYRFVKNKDGPPIITVGKVSDIHQQKMLEEQVKLDSLTGCYSKSSVEELILARLKENKPYFGALLFIDIDGFRAFNEKNGHFYGDEVLRQLVKRINSWKFDRDIVGRIGGDEFVVFIDKVSDDATLNERLDKLSKTINTLYTLPDMEADIGVSIGVVLCDQKDTTYEYYMRRADKALMMSKVDGRGKWMHYNPSVDNLDSPSLTKFNRADKISGLDMDHTISSAIFNILYERNSDETAINSALRYLVQNYNSDRSFIVESFDGGQNYGITYEWCRPGVTSYIDTLPLAESSSIKNLFDYASDSGMYVCDDINDCYLSVDIPPILASKEAKSFLHSQIKKDDKVTFFIVVENCHCTQTWTEAQVNTLHYLSRIFSIILRGNHLNDEVKLLSEHSKVSAFVGANTDNFIYIVDPDTYEMKYMNKKALDMYGNPSESYWKSKKCYELLHNKTEPCDFCTNKYVMEGSFYEWTYYNPIFDKTYLFKDKLIRLDEKLVKLQVATDITNVIELENKLQEKLDEQTLLLNCIRMLHTGQSPDVSIEAILGVVCNFFGACRGTILQVSMDGLTVNNTHEWVGKNAHSFKPFLQGIPMPSMRRFINSISSKNSSYLSNIANHFSENKAICNALNKTSVNDLICSAINDTNDKFIGLLSVENPTKNTDKHWLCTSLSVFIADFLSKNKLISSLNRLSYFDTLTGVKNRHSFAEVLRKIDGDNIHSLGVAYIDIKGLARINEHKGIRYGDEVIRKLSEILCEIFDDNIFRVGGDEFVVLEKNISEQNFEGKIKILREAIYDEPDLNASIGFTWNANSGNMSAPEQEQHNTILGSRSYTTILSKNLENEIKNGKYMVFLQPQINLQTNTLDGAEALIRRTDANGVPQPPISFVPFYEKEGMISKIDLYVFTTVCQLLKRWDMAGIDSSLKISVNFSRATIMETGIVDTLSDICDQHSVNRSMFMVEITETMSQSDDKAFIGVVAALRSAGFCVSLDDFGSGHANLSSLKISDFDEIKIDMGITRDLATDHRAKVLTKVALNLCNELTDMVSVAEGIETPEQLDILRNLGCQKGQGYYFSRPISIDDFQAKYFSDIL